MPSLIGEPLLKAEVPAAVTTKVGETRNSFLPLPAEPSPFCALKVGGKENGNFPEIVCCGWICVPPEKAGWRPSPQRLRT